MVISKNLIVLFIISIVFPSGIGLSVVGNNIDINKVCYLFCLALVLIFWIKNPSVLNKYDTLPLFLLLSIIPFSVFWISNIQYLIFFASIILFFSSYYVGRIMFVTYDSFLFFLKNISLAYIIIGIVGIINFYFDIFSLDIFRPNSEDYVSYQTRGNIIGGDFVILAYKGLEWHTHFFATNRFIWMSLSLAFYIYFERKNIKINFSNILLFSATLGFIEILLAQTRYLSLMSFLVFSVLLFFKPNKTWFYVSLFFSIPVIILFVNTDTFFYYYQALSTLFRSDLTNEEGQIISYVLQTDKRYLSLMAIINNLPDPRIYLSYGPLFYNYVGDYFMGARAGDFDDLTPNILLFLEYGFLTYFFLIFYIFFVIFLKGTSIKKYINYILILVIFSVAASHYPRYIFYLFFFLGVCFSMSYKSSFKIYK